MRDPLVHAWSQLGDVCRDCQTSLEALLAGPQQALEDAQKQILRFKKQQAARNEQEQNVRPVASLSVGQPKFDVSGPLNEAVIWVQARLQESKKVLSKRQSSRLESRNAKEPEYRVRKNETATLSRTLEFWKRSVYVYGSYKVCQAQAALIKDPIEKQAHWDRQHEAAAEKLYRLCVDLGGFFLKSGQFLAKPDLVPPAWVKRLSVLQDAAPETPFEDVKKTLEKELGRPVEDVFAELRERPIGSASVAQVHRGRLRVGNHDVAVKVQHPGAEALMMQDLRNHRSFAAFLQKFELPFDLLSVLAELEHQVQYEFDFQHEAESMDIIGRSLEGGPRRAHKKKWESPVLVPHAIPGLVTRQVLVMDFLDGVQITRLKDEMKKRKVNPDGLVARRAKRKILEDLSAAYGHMIIQDGFFQADPHPGNIIVCKGGKVGLLDYGQTKRLPDWLRLQYARLVLALNQKDELAITTAFKGLGIETEKHPDVHSISDMARIMFDTQMPKDKASLNPFTDASEIRKNPVTAFPKDLFFVLRTVQLLRGLAEGMGLGEWSVAETWKHLAEDALSDGSEVVLQKKPRGWLPSFPGRPFAWKRKHKEKRRHVEPLSIEGDVEDLAGA